MKDKNLGSTVTAFFLSGAALFGASTTTLTTADITQELSNTPPPIISYQNEGGGETETLRLFTLPENKKNEDYYERMTGYFDGELRDFTKEESEQYEELLDSIYKPTGLNIFDLC